MRTVLLSLVLALAAILPYADRLSGPYLFDDVDAILENPGVMSPGSLVEAAWSRPDTPLAGRPISQLSFAASVGVLGPDPRAQRAVNLAIHVACALALFALLRRLLGPPHPSQLPARVPGLLPRVPAEAAAFATALLWAVHPLASECVLYVTQRTEALVSLWYLLTLVLALRSIDTRGRGRTLAAALTCAAGMATKEVMVTAPVTTLILDTVFRSGSLRAALQRNGRLHAALASAWVLLAILMATTPRGKSVGFGLGVSPFAYAGAQIDVLARYIRLVFRPEPLAIDHGVVRSLPLGELWMPALLLAALAALTAVLCRSRPRAGIALVLFGLVLAPTSSIVPIVTEVAAERRMYLAMAAPIALIVTTAVVFVRRWPRPGRVATGLATVGLATALGSATAHRSADFRDAETPWRRAAEAYPESYRAHYNLARVLQDEGRFDAALARYARAIERNPRHQPSWTNIGSIHLERAALEPERGAARAAHVAEARAALVTAAAIDSSVALTQLDLALTYALDGDWETAIPMLERAHRLDPEDPRPPYNLGLGHESLGDTSRAARYYAESARLSGGEGPAAERIARIRSVR